ncbi:maltose permease [Trichoderma citrinoviride]|uniref:Maltose permease n=1 Tax=Trichoderma citrinoviride TaxID=58853 RepID=A0A2T4BLA4_9HYPO|nr:maltose permease [Trichoderma citrinoviride]PTB70093.1 maltose permease [Trichoderma citrinoviride]
MASSANEKEIDSPRPDHVDVPTSKDASTGDVLDVDGDGGDFSQDQRLVIESARAAAAKEQSMTLLQGIKLYPKAIAWSIIISTCIVMEGYDVSLVNNFYAFPQFNEKYGELYPDGTYQVPARWQSGLSNGATVGEIIGLFINGFVSERFGYRKTVMGCLVLVAAFTAIFFTAPNVQTLLVAEILCGIPWGIFQTITVTYASEVCPVALRGYLTTYVNFCWGLGQEIGIGVIYAMLKRNDQWAYRIPYGLQWMWPLPLFVAIYFAPESPWWLVRQGKAPEAKEALLRLTSLNRETDFDADETVAMMVHTTALEEKMTAGATYWDCFKGVDLRRTEIVCMTWAIQNLSGNAFSNYSTYFLQQAGLSTKDSYSFALGQYAINMVGVFGAWGLMTMGIGRRSLYLYGLCGLCSMLFVLGFLGLVPESHRREGSLATGSIMVVWALFYQLTVGTVCYSLVGELSSRRLQIKTVVLARNLYNIVGIITNVLTPYMLNPTAWDWSNYTGFFWGGICFCCIVYTYFRIPEPRGRTFAELDVLFEKKISARKFASTKVDVFHESIDEKVMHQYDGIMKSHVEKVSFV